LGKESVIENGLDNQIFLVNGDVRNIYYYFDRESFDIVTCNPPYRNAGCGVVNEATTKAIARHEILCNLDDIIYVSAMLLKPLGKFFMIHRPDRLCDILCTMREHKIEPKIVQFVQPDIETKPTHVLIEGVYGGKKHMKVEVTKILKG
jgi:tRNA1(Val) A37 N6-methylase TrmN6